MKKAIIAALLVLGTWGKASAQESFDYGLANHVSVGVSAGTQGIGFDVATCLTKWVGVRLGVNVMPAFKMNTSVDVNANYDIGGGQQFEFEDADLNAKFSRTTFDFLVDFYPVSNFFVTAGFSFGGSELAKLTGHSSKIEEFYKAYPNAGTTFDISDFNLEFDRNGSIDGGVKVNSFRPYLGLGFGSRAVPKGRVAFRAELGAQFHGKPKVYAKGHPDVLSEIDDNEDADNIADFLNTWLKVYPVLKFRLTGRIL